MSEWLRFFPGRRAHPRVALVCIPPAGAGASAFAAWPASLPHWLDVCAVAAPGREGRIGEPCARSIDELAVPIAIAIAELELPIAVLGHSLGSWIGLAVVRLLRAAAVPVVRFFPAASRPPHAGPRLAIDTDDAALVAYLRDLGGTPDAVLENPALRALVLPALRADLELARSYSREVPMIDVPTTILCGASDAGVPLSLADRWRDVASPCDRLVFPGGHFFLQHTRDHVLAAIIERVRPRFE